MSQSTPNPSANSFSITFKIYLVPTAAFRITPKATITAQTTLSALLAHADGLLVGSSASTNAAHQTMLNIAASVLLLKASSCRVILCSKPTPISPVISSSCAFHPLYPHLHHPVSAPLTFLLFPGNPHSLGSVHLLFSLPGKLFPCISVKLAVLFPLGHRSNVI